MDVGYLQIQAPQLLVEQPAHLLSFQGCCELGGFSEFYLEFQLQADVQLDECLKQEIRWSCGGEIPWHFGGIIKSLRMKQTKRLSVVVGSNLLLLKTVVKSRVYRNLSFLDLIKTIFKLYPLLHYQIYSSSTEFRESWIQYEESDYNFLKRVLYEFACFMYVNLEGCVIVSDMTGGNSLGDLSSQALVILSQVNRQGERSLNFESSSHVALGDGLFFQKTFYRVVKIEWVAAEYKHQTESSKLNQLNCRATADSQLNLETVRPPSFGFQAARLVDQAKLINNSLVFDVHFAWDADNTVSNNAVLAQPWIGYKQGFQFIPRDNSEVLLSNLNGNLKQFIVNACLVKGQSKYNEGIKIKDNEIKLNEDWLIQIAGNESKKILGNIDEKVAGHLNFKTQHQFKLCVYKNAYDACAQQFRFKVGSSELMLNHEGIHLQSSRIELHTPLGVNAGLARLKDWHFCPLLNPDLSPHLGGEIKEAADHVHIGQAAAARYRDLVCCQAADDVISEGIPDVFIEGQQAAYFGAKTMHGGSIDTAAQQVVSIGMGVSTGSQLTSKLVDSPEYWVHWLEV